MKPTVIITKMGSICYTEHYNRNNRNKRKVTKGEQGTTIAVIHHLLSLDFNVIYFGQFRGILPDGLYYVESDIVGHKDTTTVERQKEGFKQDIIHMNKILCHLRSKPVAFIAVAGYANNIATVDNEFVIQCQACAVRYCGPSINIMRHYNLPRITICNDIRNYPNEGEIASEGWEALRSVALLSQRERYWIKSLQYEHWYVDEKYAAAEHWRLFDKKSSPEKTVDCQIVAHAHMKDGKRLKGYDEVWCKILGGSFNLPAGLKIYGLGWEHFSMYSHNPDLFPGIADMKEVFARSKCTVITMTGGELYTNKARFALSQNCLPLFYGNGGPYTMDPLGKYLGLNCGFRIVKPSDLLRVVNYFCDNEKLRQIQIDKLWEMTSPDYSMLDKCIQDIAEGRDVMSDAWRDEYGGYYRRPKNNQISYKKRI